MDMARGPCGIRNFSPEPLMEHPLPLALYRIDAQHQSRGPRRRAPSLAVFLSANASCSSVDCPHLDRRPAGVVIPGAAETLPLSRLELSGRVYGFLCFAREELLSVAGLSHAPGGGRRGDRSVYRALARCLVETWAGGCFAGRRRVLHAHRGSDSLARRIHHLHEVSAYENSAYGAQPRRCDPAAVVRRPVRMAGNRRRNRPGLEPYPGRGARRLRYLCTGLWPGRRHRFFRTTLRSASRPQWAPDIFSVGTARLFRKLPDRAG